VDDAVRRMIDASFTHAEGLAKRFQAPLPERFDEDAMLPFPPNLSDLDEASLGAHLAQWRSLASYMGYQASVFEGAALRAEEAAQQEFDARYAGRSEIHVTDKRHLTGASAAYTAKKTRAVRLRSDFLILSALKVGYEGKYAAVSRELSRRTSERTMEG